MSTAPAPTPDPVPVPPTPVPPVETGDIVLPMAGVVSIMPLIRGITGFGWSLNGTSQGFVKSMASGFIGVGTFAAGKGLTFGLTYIGRKYHVVNVIPVTDRIWVVLLGQTTNYTVSFLVKLT